MLPVTTISFSDIKQELLGIMAGLAKCMVDKRGSPIQIRTGSIAAPKTRAQIIETLEKETFAEASNPEIAVKPLALKKRGGRWLFWYNLQCNEVYLE